MTTFETPGRVLVRASIGTGEIDVDTHDAPVTDVVLEALRDDEASRAAIAQATVEAHQRGDRTEIVVELPRKGAWALLGRGPSIAVRIRCPHGADAALATGAADIRAAGRLGDVEVKTASGDAVLGRVDSIRAATASGDVTVEEVAARGEVKTASGHVRVGLAHGPLSLNLVSGGVTVAEARDGLSVATVSGDQEVGSVDAGSVKLQSVSGDVSVGVRPGKRVWIDATSVSGETESELDLTSGAGEAGQPDVELRVRSVSGDIRILRAAAFAAT